MSCSIISDLEKKDTLNVAIPIYCRILSKIASKIRGLNLKIVGIFYENPTKLIVFCILG